MVRYKSEFPVGPERKKLIEDAKQTSDEMRSEGALLDAYSWLDSSLDRSPDGSMPFRKTFAGVLPKDIKTLRQYIEMLLADVAPDERIFIEFGGPGKKVAGDFTRKFFKQSFGMTLADPRYPRSIVTDLLSRAGVPASHTVLEGNLLKDEDYAPLDAALGGRKAALIIERMAKGLRNAPIEPYAMAALLQRWYGYLANGGVMLIQTPVGFNKLLAAWVEHVQETCGDTLEIRFHQNEEDEAIGTASSALFIRKREGAPDILPMLDPKTVRDIGREGYASTHYERKD